MKFYITVKTFGDFNTEAFLRALNPDCRITAHGNIIGWFSREEMDRIEEWGLSYYVHY